MEPTQIQPIDLDIYQLEKQRHYELLYGKEKKKTNTNFTKPKKKRK